MREIKFRAWDKGFKKMRLTGMGINRGILTSDDIVMQSTGLKDKNGKEIYEGDILRLDEFFLDWLVEWHEGGFYLRHKTDNKAYFPLEEQVTITRHIVGNIYENPELLK